MRKMQKYKKNILCILTKIKCTKALNLGLSRFWNGKKRFFRKQGRENEPKPCFLAKVALDIPSTKVFNILASWTNFLFVTWKNNHYLFVFRLFYATREIFGKSWHENILLFSRLHFVPFGYNKLFSALGLKNVHSCHKVT